MTDLTKTNNQVSESEAWRDFMAALEETRTTLLEHAERHGPKARDRALYAVHVFQAAGFTMAMAPRRTHPSFYIHQVFMPHELTWGGPCPEYLYRWAYADGSRGYRISGQRGTTPFAEVQVLDGFWADEKVSQVTSIHIDDYVKDDGSFEIIISPDKQPGPWVALPRDSRKILLQSREIWNDWYDSIGMTMRIEPLDPFPDENWLLSEEQIADRLQDFARWMRFNTRFAVNRIDKLIEMAGGVNQFHGVVADGDGNAGLVGAYKNRMGYAIEPDEALVLEFDAVDGLFWSFSQSDIWYLSPDFAWHQSSINNKQAHVDSDGRCRVVVSVKDPGVANWLDTVEATRGMVNWRGMRLQADAPEITVTRVKLDDVLSHLPNDTAMMSPEQRRELILRRAKAVLQRWGF